MPARASRVSAGNAGRCFQPVMRPRLTLRMICTSSSFRVAQSLAGSNFPPCHGGPTPYSRGALNFCLRARTAAARAGNWPKPRAGVGRRSSMAFDVHELDLPGLAMLRAERMNDERGWFRELFCDRRLEDIGIRAHFVQDNMSFSAAAGTLRGLHAQRPPMAQAKLITVVTGAIFDATVDCRKDSATFRRHQSILLCGGDGGIMYVPCG